MIYVALTRLAKYCNVHSSAFPGLMDPSGSEEGQECIFSTLNTYQATFISEIFSYDCRNWKFDGAGRDGKGQTDMKVGIVM